MKVNLNKPFIGIDGKAVKVGDEEQMICDRLGFTLFNLVDINGKQATPEQKYMAYCLLRKIKQNPDELDITTEEGTLLKAIAAETLSAGAYGQIYDIIENK